MHACTDHFIAELQCIGVRVLERHFMHGGIELIAVCRFCLLHIIGPEKKAERIRRTICLYLESPDGIVTVRIAVNSVYRTGDRHRAAVRGGFQQGYLPFFRFIFYGKLCCFTCSDHHAVYRSIFPEAFRSSSLLYIIGPVI